MALPKDAQERKNRPIARGVLDYFPDAIAEVAHVSWVANEQHNPGEEMHWAKEKSTDEADSLVRHLIERGTRDTDGLRHSAKVAWRGLALLQREIEEEAERERIVALLIPDTRAEARHDESMAAGITGEYEEDDVDWDNVETYSRDGETLT